jgi:hypothetical protein
MGVKRNSCSNGNQRIRQLPLSCITVANLRPDSRYVNGMFQLGRQAIDRKARMKVERGRRDEARPSRIQRSRISFLSTGMNAEVFGIVAYVLHRKGLCRCSSCIAVSTMMEADDREEQMIKQERSKSQHPYSFA